MIGSLYLICNFEMSMNMVAKRTGNISATTQTG